MTQRIEPVGPRRDAAPVELRILTPVEREADRERREQERERRRRRARQRPATPAAEAADVPRLDVRA